MSMLMEMKSKELERKILGRNKLEFQVYRDKGSHPSRYNDLDFLRVQGSYPSV